MNADAPMLPETILMAMVSHTLTYFRVGVLAFLILDHAQTFYSDRSVAASSRPPPIPWSW